MNQETQIASLKADLNDAVEMIETLRRERDFARGVIEHAMTKLDGRSSHTLVAAILRAALE